MMRTHRIASFVLAALAVLGCAPSTLTLRPQNYDVDVRLQAPTNTLEADTAIEFEQLEAVSGKKRTRVELWLHPDLEVRSVEVAGATLRAHKQRKGKSIEGALKKPTRHRLILENPTDRLRVSLGYDGVLRQDVASGEKPGEIHNFSVSAHVANEGLYLEPSGYWYPRVEFPKGTAPEQMLAGYKLSVRPVEGFELVAGAEREEDRDDGALRWRSPFPLDGLVLLGGPLERSSLLHDGIRLHAVLAPGKQEVARDILAASAEYLDRYQELIGPYPFKEFTVLEAFFSSGFAFPTCTQIVGSQLTEYKQYRRHGYLDHELLHNWYGNGIFVDPDDGNWCEGLASYMGNYYGYVLDGDEDGARKQLRNQSNFLSAIDPKNDRPLGTFGQHDGAGRGIGYQKAASVFHMLERKIGRDAMFAGLRRLTAERMGKFAAWDDLREAFEHESGVELDGFFQQWVRTGGAPLLELMHADHRPGSEVVTVTISQGPTAFELDVPLRLYYGDTSEDIVVGVDEPLDTVEVSCRPEGLTAIELDPDYHLFRRLKRDEMMPTSSVTSRAKKLLVVVPDEELAEGYRILLDLQYGKDGEKRTVVVRAARDIEAADLSKSSVLVLGDAVRHPAVVELLGRTRNPVTWGGDRFAIEGDEYAAARQAVYFTVHHPDLAESGVTVYYGNSAAALSNATVLSYYANSLLVFDTPNASTGFDSGEAMPRAEVIRRMDFEFHERIDF